MNGESEVPANKDPTRPGKNFVTVDGGRRTIGKGPHKPRQVTTISGRSVLPDHDACAIATDDTYSAIRPSFTPMI